MKKQDIHMQVGVGGKLEIEMGQGAFPVYMQRLKEKMSAVEAGCEIIQSNTDLAVAKAEEAESFAQAAATAGDTAMQAAEAAAAAAVKAEQEANRAEGYAEILDVNNYYNKEEINNTFVAVSDYVPFTGATAGANGTMGPVPAPTMEEVDMVLGAHGGWRRLPRDYELPVATSDTLGGIKIGNFFGLDEENRLILHGLAEYLASIVPVGTILPYAAELSIPNGFLPCNGAEVKEEDYPELYEAIGTRYGFANAPDKFCLPNLGDSRFMQFEDIGVGSQVAAGLPNITGHAEEIYLTDIYNESTLSSSAYADGAFEWVQGTHFNKNSDSGGAGYGKALSFSASRSNAIYGRSNTVQPKALTLRAIIKY